MCCYHSLLKVKCSDGLGEVKGLFIQVTIEIFVTVLLLIVKLF